MTKKIKPSQTTGITRRSVVICTLTALALLVVARNVKNRSSISNAYSSLLAGPSGVSARVASTVEPVTYTSYVPAESEAYIMSHTAELKLDVKSPSHAATCHIWTDASTTPHHKDLMAFHGELAEYYKLVGQFNRTVPDVRKYLNDDTVDICPTLELHAEGMPALFPSGQLSFTRAGFVEPLLPSMRHADICLKGLGQGLFNMNYMLHDFAHMCRRLKPDSKIIFVDMGASLSFHAGQSSPAMYIIELYRKFGFPFDHIYAYEMTPTKPEQVVNLLPKNLMAAYHWINVGVESDPNSKKNPWAMLLEHYTEDDFVVVKLDIDTPVLERELADQFLNNPQLLKLVDQFYFEHHVNQQELASNWGPTKESVEDSLKLFRQLREKGVASHFWV